MNITNWRQRSRCGKPTQIGFLCRVSWIWRAGRTRPITEENRLSFKIRSKLRPTNESSVCGAQFFVRLFPGPGSLPLAVGWECPFLHCPGSGWTLSHVAVGVACHKIPLLTVCCEAGGGRCPIRAGFGCPNPRHTRMRMKSLTELPPSDREISNNSQQQAWELFRSINVNVP